MFNITYMLMDITLFSRLSSIKKKINQITIGCYLNAYISGGYKHLKT